MSVVVFCVLLLNIWCHSSGVAAFAWKEANIQQTLNVDFEGSCISILGRSFQNTPCGETEDVVTKFNATTLAAAASSWNDKLRLEFTMLSMESHILFCSDKDVEDEIEHRVIAKAVFDMLISLHTMQRTEEILTDVTLTAIEDDLKRTSCVSPNIFFHQWLISLNESMNNELLLVEEYSVKRVRAKLDTSRNLDQETCEVYYPFDCVKCKLCNFTIFREAYVNRVFMKRAFGHRRQDTSNEDRQRHLLAKAVVELARALRNGYERSIFNQMYRSALLEAAQEMTCDENPSCDKEGYQVENRLFGILESWLNATWWMSSALNTRLRYLEASDILLENRNSTL